jgi:hypothetical protein
LEWDDKAKHSQQAGFVRTFAFIDQTQRTSERVMRTRFLLPATAVAIIGTMPVLLSALPHVAVAQQNNPVLTNVIPQSEEATIHAKITAINPSNRWVTLAGASGRRVTVIAGPAVRLNMLKVGDRVNAKYYRSVGFAVNPPTGGNGVPVSDDQMAQILAQPVQAPGGVGVRLTKVSGNRGRDRHGRA